MQHPDLFLRLLAHAIIRECNGADSVSQKGSPTGRRLYSRRAPLGRPKVRRKNDATALLNRVLNGCRCANTSVVLNFTVFDGNVEVNSNEDRLACRWSPLKAWTYSTLKALYFVPVLGASFDRGRTPLEQDACQSELSPKAKHKYKHPSQPPSLPFP